MKDTDEIQPATRPVIAIVGSATDNGDTVVSSLQNLAQVVEYAEDEGIPGLLQPGYRVESQM